MLFSGRQLLLGQLHNLNYFVPLRVPIAALELARSQALALNEPAHNGQLHFFCEHQRHFCGEQRMGFHGGVFSIRSESSSRQQHRRADEHHGQHGCD